MTYPNKFDLLLAMTLISIIWNIVSADSSSKNNFPSSDHSSNIGSAVSRSFSYANFGNSNPVAQQTHNSRGHNNHGDKITPRDTSAASSYTPGAPLPQQPDPSIALLPRGEQQNSLFAKEGSAQGNLFSGSSSTSETGEFGGSPLGYPQGLQITGFPQGTSFANLGFTPSSQSAGALQQGISSGRTTQGSSIARIPQGFPLAGFQQPFGSPLGGYTQGIPLAGFPQGAAFGGFPQGATFGAYAPPGSPLGGFPQGLAFSPVPGQGFVPGAPYRGSQQGPSRASTYSFASPVAYSPQLYRQVPAQSYTSQ